MFKNYLTVAIRNLMRHKINTVINIGSLAVAMTVVVLIGVFVHKEWSYDRFHKQADQIYRVLRQTHFSGDNAAFTPGQTGALANMLRESFPEVQQAVRVWKRYLPVWAQTDAHGFDQHLWLVDPHFLTTFTFPLVNGDAETALNEPNTIVITERVARQYFGDENPLGRVIDVKDRIFDGQYTVTGVLQNVPSHSSLQFDLLISTVRGRYESVWNDWRGVRGWQPVQTFVTLPFGQNLRGLEQKFPDMIDTHLGKDVRDQVTYHLQPLTRMHLYSRTDYGAIRALVDDGLSNQGDIVHVYMLCSIGIFVLLIACVNFTNLATARATLRSQEVGLRKVVGANRTQLIGQFLGESILLALLAFLLTLGLLEFAVPAIGWFTGKTFGLELYGNLLPLLFGFAVLVGFLAGIYPAFILSSFRPITSLNKKQGLGGGGLRKVLVTVQFALSILLIVGAVTVDRQLSFMQNKPLGFDDDHVVVLPIFGMDWNMKTNPDDRLSLRYQTVKQAFLKHSNIIDASAYRHLIGPLGGGSLRVVSPEGEQGTAWRMRVQETDENFIDTFDMKLVAGRNFSSDQPADLHSAVLLNEMAVKKLGWTEPLGKTINIGNRRLTVIGVVRDYHNLSLREEIEPVAMCMWYAQIWNLALKVRAENMSETLAFMASTWETFLPGRDFEYMFQEESLDTMYREDIAFGQMIAAFSMFAIGIACLGLFGLVTFVAERRTKEIGIRKVLGASISNITLMLSGEFLRLIVLANVIAWPVAYYVVDIWLQSFAYRMDLSIATFVLSGLAALIIALLTVSYQAVKVARANPVDALRNE